MRTLVAIAIAGALGALARYEVEGIVSDRVSAGFPFGTLVVNISGAFLLGLTLTVLMGRLTTPAWLRVAVTVGFLGAYTTFSTLMYETFAMFDDGVPIRALMNLIGSMILGMLAVFTGVVIGRTI